MITRIMNALLVGLLALSLWHADAWAQQVKREGLIQYRYAALQPKWVRLMRAGDAALQQGNLDEAIKQTKTALDVAEAFGPGDLRLATTLTNLAMLYKDQGRTGH